MKKNSVLLCWLGIVVITLFTGCGSGGPGGEYTVTGRVTDNYGTPIPEVQIMFSRGGTVITDSNGQWTQSGLSGTVVITPVNEGWVFTPANVTVSQAETNIVFSGSTSTSYSLSGQIKDANNNPIPNITVNFSGGFASTITGSDGRWSQSGLMGIVTITPQSNDWYFSPPYRTVSKTHSGLIFLGTSTQIQNPFSGKLVYQSGSPYDIYLIDGTQQTRLTTNQHNNMYARLSPDKAKIVFHSNRDGNNEIYVMNIDGTNQTRLTNHTLDDYSPNWSPDGAKIVFVSQRDHQGYGNIYVMNADGSNQTPLTSGTSDDGPCYSPDGSKIVFIRNDRVYIMNNDGTNIQQITHIYSDDPSWSPDGSKIVFEGDNNDTHLAIYVVNIDGSNLTRLTDSNLYDSANPDWSPDGSQIAFDCDKGNAYPNGIHRIYIMNANGTNLTRLTENAGYAPGW